MDKDTRDLCSEAYSLGFVRGLRFAADQASETWAYSLDKRVGGFINYLRESARAVERTLTPEETK